MPVRVLDDPQGDTHTLNRKLGTIPLNIQTTALASPTFMLSIFVEIKLVNNIILASFY